MVGICDDVIGPTRLTMRAAFIHVPFARSGPCVIVASLAPTSRFAGVDTTFDASIRSFGALADEQAAAAQPGRLDFYTVRLGDTWASVAEGASGGHVKPSTLAIMNGSDPGTPPRPGDRIRVVVGG